MAVVEDGVVNRLEVNPAGTVPGGGLLKPCPRGFTLHHEHYAKTRLRSPLIAVDPPETGTGRFREASWDEALALVAERLASMRSRDGSASTIGLGSAGSIGAVHDSEGLLERFVETIGGGVGLSGNYSSGAANFALPYLFGQAYRTSGWDAATVRYSNLIVLWGANVVETRLGTALGDEVVRAARSGTPVVCIDPRRTRTAKASGARWIPILPGTDAAMMLAMLHTLFSGGLVDMESASRLATGIDDLARYVLGQTDGVPKSAAWAAPICGIPADVIINFTRDYASARPAMLIPGYSIQRVADGENPFRLTVALQIVTGNFGVRGGSTGSINSRLPGPVTGTFPPVRHNTHENQEIPEAGGDTPVNSAGLQNVSPTVPVVRWPDAILGGQAAGYPSTITTAIIGGFNAVNQGGDVHKSVRALRSLDFSVCLEMFMTPTAMQCDVVLPVLSALEKEDMGFPWLGNHLLYKRAAVPVSGQARSDYDIYAELSERMRFGTAFSGGRTASQWLEQFLSDSEVIDHAAFIESGIYFGPGQERVGLAAFAEAPEDNPLPTPSGKVEIFSTAWEQDTGRPPLPVWNHQPSSSSGPSSLPESTGQTGVYGMPDVADGHFLLVTPKTIWRTHSQNGAQATWADRSGDRGILTMNPADATSAGLSDGDIVLVSNSHGASSIHLRTDEEVMPGVVCLHQGVWFDFDADGIDHAGSANVLTSTDGTGPANAPVMHGVPVMVQKDNRP